MSSNKTNMRLTEICADCGSLDPSWALVNRGLLVCDECVSVHRSLGRHISQVKSLKKSHWSPSQLAMVNALNSGGVNNLWEHNLADLKKKKPTPKDPVHPTKEEFIKLKHQSLAFIPRSSEASEEELSQNLHSSVRTGNLETSLRLLAQGANPNYHHPEKGNRALHVAAKAGQMSQVELLLVHGANPAARDSTGNTPAQCARLGGNREVAIRLTEALYEVTDRLTYFLSRVRPDHSQGVHLILPCPADCVIKPRHPRSNPSSPTHPRMAQLTNSQLEDLAMDVYDEVDRRETESIWGQSGASLEHGSVPFLPVNPELSSMRNQGRQKLATCSPQEFSALVLDLLTEAKRRHTATERLSMRPGQKESDDEPLYDSVASDEDYASAEQLAILVAQNAKGLPLNISEVGERGSSELEKELKQRLAASEAKANRLNAQIGVLNARVEEVSSENLQLKLALKQQSALNWSSGGSNSTLVGGGGGPQSLGSVDTALSGASSGESVRVSGGQRPASMYEPRDSAQQAVGRMPLNDEVMKRSRELTKRIQELWGSMRPQHPNHHRESAQHIREAVKRLSSIFPQKLADDTLSSALRQLSTSAMKLEAHCSELEKSAEQVRESAFALAMANKQIVTKCQSP